MSEKALNSNLKGIIKTVLRGLVPRHSQITVRYFDQQGNVQQKELTGFLARIFQHELDHLNGLTFIDQLESTKDLISEVEWYQQFAKTL